MLAGLAITHWRRYGPEFSSFGLLRAQALGIRAAVGSVVTQTLLRDRLRGCNCRKCSRWWAWRWRQSGAWPVSGRCWSRASVIAACSRLVVAGTGLWSGVGALAGNRPPHQTSAGLIETLARMLRDWSIWRSALRRLIHIALFSYYSLGLSCSSDLAERVRIRFTAV